MALLAKGETPWPDLAGLYSVENCLSYRQGSASLIAADLELHGLELDDASPFQAELRSAFSFRKELISFKKAFLLLYQQAQRVEKSLRQVGLCSGRRIAKCELEHLWTHTHCLAPPMLSPRVSQGG